MNKKSGHWTNTGMAKFINDNLYNYKSDDEKSMNPFRWYRLQNGDDVSKYRETINGFPCRLILINDGSTPLNEGQNEPTPGNTKDMGIFNFNNDKDNVATLGFDSDIFPNCASYEVTANSDTSAGAFMSYKGDKNAFDYVVQSSTMNRTTLIPIDANNLREIKVDVYHTLFLYREDKTWLNNIVNQSINTTNTLPSDAYYVSIAYEKAIDNITVNGVNYKQINNLGSESGNIVKDFYYLASEGNSDAELAYLKESFELRHPDADDVAEDWGFMGVEEKVLKIDEYLFYGNIRTSTMEANYFNSDSITIIFDNNVNFSFVPTGNNVSPQYGVPSGTTISLEGVDRFNLAAEDWTYVDINGNRYYKGITRDEGVHTRDENPYESTTFNTSYGLKALIDWVDNCTDEEFIRDFEQHFHKDYTLRYFCLVTLIGAVDKENCPL